MKCKMGAENAQFSGGQPKVVADAKHGQYNVICVSFLVGVKMLHCSCVSGNIEPRRMGVKRGNDSGVGDLQKRCVG